MAYTEPPYLAGGINGDTLSADDLNLYADNLDALIAILASEVNSASNTKERGTHPLFTFCHRNRYLAYISEGKDSTGAIVGLREEEEHGEEVRLPYVAGPTPGFFDLDEIEWMAPTVQYVMREVRFAMEVP